MKQPQELIQEEEDKIEDLKTRIAELCQRVGPGLQLIQRHLTDKIESSARCETSTVPEFFTIPASRTCISTTQFTQ